MKKSEALRRAQKLLGESAAVINYNEILPRQGGWRSPYSVGRWLGLPLHSGFDVYGSGSKWRRALKAAQVRVQREERDQASSRNRVRLTVAAPRERLAGAPTRIRLKLEERP